MAAFEIIKPRRHINPNSRWFTKRYVDHINELRDHGADGKRLDVVYANTGSEALAMYAARKGFASVEALQDSQPRKLLALEFEEIDEEFSSWLDEISSSQAGFA